MMEDDIIELHRALQEARGLDSRSDRYRIHTAKVQDIRDLSELDDGGFVIKTKITMAMDGIQQRLLNS